MTVTEGLQAETAPVEATEVMAEIGMAEEAMAETEVVARMETVLAEVREVKTAEALDQETVEEMAVIVVKMAKVPTMKKEAA